MKNTLKGFYSPLNPEKYIGKGNIIYRSSWELLVCQTCDKHPAILHWASEPFSVPYFNPVTKRQTIYIPDFLVVYQDKDGNVIKEVWEIKPKNQSVHESAKRKSDQIALAVNIAKWNAAKQFCSQRGLDFRIINEGHLFK